MDLIELYKDILEYVNMKADSNGYIFWKFNKEEEPVVENGKRMVLPTLEHLKNPMEKLIFHPLHETFVQVKVPPVINILRRSINSRLNVGCFVLAKSLLVLAASPELHKHLSPDQMGLLVKLKDVDKTTVTNFINIGTKGMMKQNDRHFVNIYLKRGGSIGEKRYARVGVVSFHFYSELLKENKENTIYDVKIRVKDREMYKAVMEYIFPQINDETAYNYGSDCSVAPWLDSLMKTSMKIASCFVDIDSNFSQYIDEKECVEFNFDWVDAFDNLEKWGPIIRQIPLQSSGEPVASTPSVPTPSPVPQTPGFPAVPTPPVPMPFNQQPQAPGLVHTGNGLDFNSLIQSSPAIQQSVLQSMGMAHPMMAPMPAPRQPSWAQPTILSYQTHPAPNMTNQWQQPQNTGFGQPPMNTNRYNPV